MTVVEETSLAFRQGTSDKVYLVQLLQEEDGWSVAFAYGRRGGHQTKGTKVEGVSEAQARKAYQALVKEKEGRGYHEAARPPRAGASLVLEPRVVAQQAGISPREMPPVMLAESIKDDARQHVALLERTGKYVAEVKLDGMRVLVLASNGQVRLFSRYGNEVTSRFPEVVVNLADQLVDLDGVILDGEVGFLDVTGLKMDIAILQKRARTDLAKVRLQAEKYPMSIGLWDVLRVGDAETWRLPMRERRTVLEELVRPSPHVQVVPQRHDMVRLYDDVVEAGGEGVMVKAIGHVYQPGVRSRDWLKAKAPSFRVELHVVGLVEGKGARNDTFGAFVLARRTPEGYEYVCCAGSGLSNVELARVMKVAPGIAVESCPLAKRPVLGKPVEMWLDPQAGLLADIKYDQKTKKSPRFPRVINVRFPGEV